MADRAIVLLTTDVRVARHVRETLPNTKVATIACLREIRPSGRISLLLVDPGSLEDCCLNHLAAWRKSRLPEIVYLALAHAAGTISRLNSTRLGVIAPFSQLPALTQSRSMRTGRRTTLAWERRQSILLPFRKTARARRFLALATASDHEPCSVTAMASALGISVRHLSRLSVVWFGHPPGVVINLIRIRSVARELACTSITLETIADRHGFSAASAMSRLFQRVTGTRPGTYRRASGCPTSGKAIKMADCVIDKKGVQRDKFSQ